MTTKTELAIANLLNYFTEEIDDAINDPAQVKEVVDYLANAPAPVKAMLVAAAEELGLSGGAQ